MLYRDELKEEIVYLGFLLGQQEELRTWCHGKERASERADVWEVPPPCCQSLQDTLMWILEAHIRGWSRIRT